MIGNAEPQQDLLHAWKAIVTIDGVPEVTDDEAERVVNLIKGALLRHDEKTRQLTLTWRFMARWSSHAIQVAGGEYRRALDELEGETGTCVDFRVFRVAEL